MKEFTATFVVSSDSPDKLRDAKQLAAGEMHLDKIYADAATANDRVIVHHRRLSDYFSSVQVSESGPTSFRLVFVPRPNADNYWKDMVIKVILAVRAAGVSVRPEKRPFNHDADGVSGR